jgi:hypothetical protein
MVTASSDGILRMWDLASKNIVRIYQGTDFPHSAFYKLNISFKGILWASQHSPSKIFPKILLQNYFPINKIFIHIYDVHLFYSYIWQIYHLTNIKLWYNNRCKVKTRKSCNKRCLPGRNRKISNHPCIGLLT